MTKSMTLKYRPDIDGLRAIAVMSVLLYHAFPTIFRSGYIGVDIFFVISGFLITTIIRKEVLKGEFTILAFYKKRIRRIYPALILTLLIIIYLSWFLLSTSEFGVTLKHVILSSVFSENFLLWSEDGYFDKASIFKPTLHIWSLSIEEQFYIFWPFILTFLVLKNMEVKGILFFILLSFSINIYDISIHPAAAYYSPLGRSWELMVGSLFAIIYSDIKKKYPDRKGNQNYALFGLVMVLLSIFIIPSQQYFPGLFAIPVVLGSALIIFFGEQTLVERMLSVRAVVFVGLISYPLYLVHWPLMSFSSIILGYASDKANALCLIVSIFIALFIYIFIEKPISKQNLTVSYWLLVIMIIIPMSSLFLLGTKSRINEVKLPNENEWTFLKNSYHKFGLDSFNNNGTGVYTISGSRSNEFYFLGDSHMANLAEYIYGRVRHNNSAGAVIAAGGGCIPIPGVYTNDQRRQSCWKMRSSVLELLQNKDIKNVVFGGAWYMYFYDKKDYFFKNKNGKYLLSETKGRELAINSMMDIIKELSSKGKTVYFIKDAPYI